tara:strand:- start:89 stop:1210 length:1122 start_codon:yes stop_codon:yes gene_type:complete
MQGLQSLDQFKDFVSSIGGLGRYEDTYIVHAAEGETVVPMEVLDQNPVLKKRLFKTMVEMGIEPGRYIVGNELNSKNPITGQPEFFLKKIINRVKKAAADISGYAAPIVGAMYGPAAGALTGGILGSFKRENPGDPTQGLNMALLGGGSGIASNLLGGASGMDLLTNKGLSGDKFLSPMKLYEKYTSGDGVMANLKDYAKIFDSAKTVTGEGSSEIIKSIGESIASGDVTAEKGIEAITKLLSEESKKSGLSISQLASIYGLGTLGLGAIIGATSDDGDIGLPADTMPEGNVLEGIVNPVYASRRMASGGVMDLQDGGESVGPGTGTSDSIPAMLSDGEFVMTAKAVRGAGGGDRREGARKMYEAMDKLEAQA